MAYCDRPHAVDGDSDRILFARGDLRQWGYVDGDVSGGALILTLIGFTMLTLGGWLGGSVVCVRGMRVLNLVHEPARRAAAPVPRPEKELADQ
ncbi:MAG TPA: hypothetical protein VE615_10405, partial [Gaiellaceae bacterium]|nr:hypothetical protein [Gaiellaceae bacterium]